MKTYEEHCVPTQSDHGESERKAEGYVYVS